MAAAGAPVVTEDALLAKLDEILAKADLSTFTMRKARSWAAIYQDQIFVFVFCTFDFIFLLGRRRVRSWRTILGSQWRIGKP